MKSGIHQIYSQQIIIGESDTAVHHHNIIFTLINSDILADLTQAAQGNDLQGCFPAEARLLPPLRDWLLLLLWAAGESSSL